MNWEAFVIQLIQAAAPIVKNLVVHSDKGVAIFNASEAVFVAAAQAHAQPQK